MRILADLDHHLIVCEHDGDIVSSCVCVIIPNLTRGVGPYACVENVVTRADARGRGYATACLNHAKALAQQAGCYKMMLTGSHDSKTLDVENVVTRADARGRGYATACLNHAKALAQQAGCYKMMLTGSHDSKTLDFYRHAGYNSADKTAFIQWL